MIQAFCERLTENVCACLFAYSYAVKTHNFHDVTHSTHFFGLSQLVAVRHTHFQDVTHGTHIFHFLQIRCRAVPARCRPSTKHLMLMPIFGCRFHFAVKVRCCCCWFILMQSDTHISMTSHTAHTFSVMRSQDACVRIRVSNRVSMDGFRFQFSGLIFSHYYLELFLPRNITVRRKQPGPLKFTCSSFSLLFPALAADYSTAAIRSHWNIPLA